MCYWQRYPHIAAIGIGVLFLFFAYRGLLVLGALSALTTGVIGVYHVGVEQKWWQGPDTCTSSSTDGLSVDQLLDQIMTAPLVRCDEIAWSLMGISMAGWNAIVSFALGPVGDSVQAIQGLDIIGALQAVFGHLLFNVRRGRRSSSITLAMDPL